MPTNPTLFVRRLGITGAIVVLVASLGSLSASLAQEGSPSAEVLESGRVLYMEQCESCHGPEGKGDGAAARFLDPAPRDFTTGEWMHAEGGTVEAIAAVVRAGIEDTGMTPFDELLTEEETLAVAAYVVHVLAKEGGSGS